MIRSKIKIDRTYTATPEELWDLWTTTAGIESWWGPEVFTVRVLKLELKPAGELRYEMTASAAPQIDFMKRAGMPLTTECKIVFTEVQKNVRLGREGELNKLEVILESRGLK